MNECQAKGCCSMAINDDPDRKLCDKCLLEKRVKELEASEWDLAGDRDLRENQVQALDIALGGTGEWSSNYDCGENALGLAREQVAELAQLKAKNKLMRGLLIEEGLWSEEAEDE